MGFMPLANVEEAWKINSIILVILEEFLGFVFNFLAALVVKH